MRSSRFEPKGRLKQQIRFQTTFLSTSRHSNQTKATHRHTHVGSTAGQTTIRSGGDTTLKGAQLIGKGIQADTRNLHIESVQDTETYQSKQQNGNVQVTVGYGFSASGDYSQSKIRADHASVTEQSGIYAGEDGYQIKAGNHTDLKGGIITSSQSAEDKGKNRFQTATLTHSDIQNHSRYEGKSFGLGASASISGKTLGQGAQNKPQNKHLTSVADKNGASSSVGYGSDSDSQSSITKSGINTQNIQITDEAAQIRLTGKTAAQTKADIDTNVTTDTAKQHSGRLKNVFDKDRVQSELDLQRTVSQDFSKNVQQANTEINQHLDKLKADKEAAETAAAEALANGDMETAKRKAHEAQDAAAKADNWQQGKVILNMLASGLAAPTQSGAGIAAATASPAVSYAIGQHFKDLAGQNANGKLTASQETAHVLAHAVLGAAVAAAGDNNALAGALSAGGSEAAAPYISKWLYGKEKGSDLTAEEKETVTAITNVLGTATGAAVGNSATDGVQGSLNAKSAVGNNYLIKEDWNVYKRKINECEKQGRKYSACYISAQKDLYTISVNRNAKLRGACSPEGDLELCKRLVAEADESRNLTRKELKSLGYIHGKTPTIPTTIEEVKQGFRIPNPSFIDYHDIPWANNPTIHYWAANISFPLFNKMDYGLSIAVNRVTGEIFLGVNASPHIKDGNHKTPVDIPSANIVMGHINNMTSVEKARLWKTITQTISGQSTTVSGCAYFGCLGVSQTIDKKKVAFEAGLGTPKQPTISFGRTHMVRVGRITFSDAN